MKNEFISAKTLLLNKNVSILDAVRLICNILDALPKNSLLTPVQFCSKVIETGKRHIHIKEMSVKDGFATYLNAKRNLRKDSFSNIKYLGNRLLKTNIEFGKRNFSELSVSDCEKWLNTSFNTPSQFNKARTMAHGLFEFAIRHEWCDKNPIKLVERRKIFEKEIKPLKLCETKTLIKNAQDMGKIYGIVAAILLYTGIRPYEVRRITWQDIDICEKIITIRSQCSKTGGVRQVEIPPVLKRLLKDYKNYEKEEKICPLNWQRRWRKIRDCSGFKGKWVQDVLRHTYASFHVKYYGDLSRLQINMGHRDQSLLRSRYINMTEISSADAKAFFN